MHQTNPRSWQVAGPGGKEDTALTAPDRRGCFGVGRLVAESTHGVYLGGSTKRDEE